MVVFSLFPFDEDVLNNLKNENVGLNVGLNKTEKKIVSLLVTIQNPG